SFHLISSLQVYISLSQNKIELLSQADSIPRGLQESFYYFGELFLFFFPSYIYIYIYIYMLSNKGGYKSLSANFLFFEAVNVDLLALFSGMFWNFMGCEII
ncbi:hypothetical protein PanWU01x14_256790, partial [Parasponia andersonii]